jgi:hypothetical protein
MRLCPSHPSGAVSKADMWKDGEQRNWSPRIGSRPFVENELANQGVRWTLLGPASAKNFPQGKTTNPLLSRISIGGSGSL